jgi:PAT family beta-lactamase induction signal transducer AmpG
MAAFLGIVAAAACTLKLGYIRSLIIGGVLQALAIAAFAMLATGKSNLLLFSAVMAGDNFSTSFAGVALVTYMSTLTSLGYTATQYALLSSAYTWAGKLMKGFSGSIVESLKVNHGLMDAYAIFFVGAGAIGIPAIVLFIVLSAHQHRTGLRSEAAVTGA